MYKFNFVFKAQFINVDNIGVTTRKTFKVSSDATIVIRDDYFKEMYPFAKEDLLKNYKVRNYKMNYRNNHTYKADVFFIVKEYCLKNIRRVMLCKRL